MREHVTKQGKCITKWGIKRGRERGGASLFPSGYVSWASDTQELFSKEPINFPTFAGFFMVHPLVILTGPMVKYPSNNPGLEGGRMGC